MKSYPIYLLLALSTLIACSENDDPGEEAPNLPYSFIDGFESQDSNIQSLFPEDLSRWTTIQNVSPETGENLASLNRSIFNEGNQSLKLISNRSSETLSKIDIEKFGFFAPVGSTITIETDIYIESDQELTDLFLLDLECCSCWDPNVDDNQCPGIRLKLGGEDNYLSIERGKILGSTLPQNQLPFPKNEWVSIKWQMILSPDIAGQNILIINGQEVINELGKNMPNSAEFKNEFENNGIDFALQTPLGYERVQIGATANPTSNDYVIYIDDFRLSITE